ncbi:flagellar motor protein MotB [Sedimentibacter sp. zth1]|uniref:flagellar motor protein MotB n=1 Tax=Sedimentibacter sp. zth1 TaxID=2816908 RepID=UPI001A91F4A5|nr:flagellar motor protein MotB [Sedimentibacter sp. zth1]QSX07192.1 flagellar motor protein MotB [Sedimentibacter sp. zth1]
MARKKKLDSGSKGSWLNTYADMVTLLLTFFILLFSMSNLDKEKFMMLVEAFSNGNNVISKPDDMEPGEDLLDQGSVEETPVIEDKDLEGLDILYQMILNYVNKNNLQDDIVVDRTEDSVFIRFRNNVFFDGYSSKLKVSGQKILDIVALGIHEADYAIEEIIVAGHTAMVESDSSSIDRKLSSDRAAEVLVYLESKDMFDKAKLLSVGYGLYRPIATNETPEGRAQNRRVEILITKRGHARSFTDYIYDVLGDREDNKNNNNKNIND